MHVEVIKWRCRRGMLELDILLKRYLDHHYSSASAQEQALFCRLIELTDPELYDQLMGAQNLRDPAYERIVQAIRTECPTEV